VNAIQEDILNAVSQDGANIFMVGDVKQSIYRFRLADPSIFLEKYRSFGDATDSGGAADGVKILLSKNFRSSAGILDAVNYLFERIMSVEFGEMDYGQQERLVCGRAAGEVTGRRPESPVEFDIIDVSSLEKEIDEESPLKTQIEAAFIARRILELVNGGHLLEEGQPGERCVEFSDIVILLRSVRDKAWQYASVLAGFGIPVDMPGGEGFFETIEISSALALLCVIDNPMQDVPLTAALCSPVYRFTADELAEIRIASRGGDFYGALVKKAETDERCAAFLNDIGEMRAVMPDMPADRCIWHMYNKTGLPGRVGAMRGGERRRNNLILLAEYARRFEKSGYKGLFGFLAYIRGLQDRGAELTRESAEPTPGCVRIMSIHKSKGLEFPVVFLADTAKRVNNQDAFQSLAVHPALGIGAKRTDRYRRIE
jgi:ATP-dependent helicase/nuclease subunit A